MLIESIFGGPTAKPAFAGQLARAGAEGARAAAAGLTGWPEVVEHPRGLVAVLGGEPSVTNTTDDLGTERWTTSTCTRSGSRAAATRTGAGQAAVELATEHGLAAADVVAVDVEAYAVAQALVDRHVSAGYSAIACTLSLPYVTAVAVVHGEVTGRQYSREVIDDPRVQELARRVTLRTAPDLEVLYPDFTASRVTVTTRDGRTSTATVDLPAGDARAPLTEDELLTKYHAYTDAVLGREAAARAGWVVLDPAATPRVRELTGWLRPGTEDGR